MWRESTGLFPMKLWWGKETQDSATEGSASPAKDESSKPRRLPSEPVSTRSSSNQGKRPIKVPQETGQASRAEKTVEDRLVALQGLQDKGLLTPEEYDEKRNEILSSL